MNPDSVPAPPELEAILRGLDQAAVQNVQNRTLRDLVIAGRGA